MLYTTGTEYVLTFIGLLVVSFLGLYVGVLLGYMAREEVNTKKFRILSDILLTSIICTLAIGYNVNVIVVLALGLALFVFFIQIGNQIPINQLLYLFCGGLLFLSARSLILMCIIASFIFIYGLAIGTLFLSKRWDRSVGTVLSDMLLSYGLYIIIGLIVNLIGYKILTT